MSSGGNRPIAMMVGVAMGCGLAIALMVQATAGQIAENRAERLTQAVGRVLPGAVEIQGYDIRDDGLVPLPADRATFIAGYDHEDSLIGVAVPARIMGYQDTIHMLFGYDPAAELLTGFVILESRETPGLGSKIGTDPEFLASLNGLDVSLAEGQLANRVTLASPRQPRTAWQVDGITGATVSSNAVAEAINRTAPQFEIVRRQLDKLRSPRSGDPTDAR
jgi:electron transport complex protein RnfG